LYVVVDVVMLLAVCICCLYVVVDVVMLF